MAGKEENIPFHHCIRFVQVAKKLMVVIVIIRWDPKGEGAKACKTTP